MIKAYNQYITEDFLKSRENVDKPTQKWILFCRYFMSKGYKIRLYEARKTVQPARVQALGKGSQRKVNGGTAQHRAQILAHQVKLKLLRPPFKLDSSKG